MLWNSFLYRRSQTHLKKPILRSYSVKFIKCDHSELSRDTLSEYDYFYVMKTFCQKLQNLSVMSSLFILITSVFFSLFILSGYRASAFV